jgi:hypothetical protein
MITHRNVVSVASSMTVYVVSNSNIIKIIRLSNFILRNEEILLKKEYKNDIYLIYH